MINEATRKIAAPLSWRDVFELKIPDGNLRDRVSGFLDFFASTEFRYDRMHPETKVITPSYLSGQSFIARCVEHQQNVIANGSARVFMPNGRFVITSHEGPFRDHFSGSVTMFGKLNETEPTPFEIRLGQQYLRGAKYFDQDGQQQPVTVDGVVAHEMAHFALATQDETICMQIEDIVVAAMGGNQRGTNYQITFSKGSNGGYKSLHHKVIRSEVADAFAAHASGDTQAGGLNTAEAPADPHSLKSGPA